MVARGENDMKKESVCFAGQIVMYVILLMFFVLRKVVPDWVIDGYVIFMLLAFVFAFLELGKN
jgi:hypothetical protein